MKKLKLTHRTSKAKGGEVVTGSTFGRFANWYSQNHYLAIGIGLVGIVALAIVIPVAIYRSMAASGAASVEPENGSPTSRIVVGSDNNASGGQFVSFSAGGGGNNNVTGGTDTSCVLQKADQPMHLAFCDGFNQPAAYNAAFSRSGDLDGRYWGVSRTNNSVNPSQNLVNDFHAATLKGCGADQKVLPTKDVQICSGRLQEAVFDYGEVDSQAGQTTLAIYPKQPFDFAGRTGTVSFDLSSDSEGSHAAWPEFWISDQPVPTPHGEYSGQFPYPRNGIGVRIAGECQSGPTWTGLDAIQIVKNYQFSTVNATIPDCPIKKSSASATGALNHFEVRVSQNHIEVWGGDPGSMNLKLLGSADNLNMTMTKGLVWMEDLHYNACKFDTQCDHTFTWDNLGFDGPAPYRDLSFDVPDSNVSKNSTTLSLGYVLPIGGTKSVQVNGVYRLQTPTSALVTFNWYPTQTKVPSFTLNGGPSHDTTWPFDAGTTGGWHTMGVTVPVSEVKDGTNTLVFKGTQNDEDWAISNINLILVAGSPVPAALQ